MKLWLPLLLLGHVALGAESPYATEARVRSDLESLLGRMIPGEQFFVQVNAEVRVDEQRKIFEGEVTEEVEAGARPAPPEPMPGFVPDTEDLVPAPGKHQRQVYRTVETPVLTALRVNVGLDRDLGQPTILQAKNYVQNFLFTNYPNQVRLGFMEMTMLKPKKETPPAPAPVPEKKEEPEETWETLAAKYLPWGLVGLLVLVMLLRRSPQPAPQQHSRRNGGKGWSQAPRAVSSMFNPANFLPQAAPAQNAQAQAAAAQGSIPAGSARGRLLDRIIANTAAFHTYYDKLSDELKADLETILAGPAFESVMDGVPFPRAQSNGSSSDVEEMALAYEAQFNEFVHAKQAQDKQFFGFLGALSREQLASLASFENDLTVCLMLRFMKPVQCAAILDGLPPQRRRSVLARLDDAQKIPLSEIAATEREIREAVRRLPTHALGPGPSPLDFWSNVLTESTHQAEILAELEVTQPDISAPLKKFKFSLEDAAALPDDLLQRAISEVDNEELALALTTCGKDVAEVVLQALPAGRAALLKEQINSLRSVPKERATRARNNFTKVIREMMAA
jgi:hypothetical protein